MAWTDEQLQNAAVIYQVGTRMGMSSRDIQIGLITAMVESNLVNVNYGDRDSLGLFQQRPSQGWGSPAQVTNPQYAATKFFTALKGVEGYRNMGMGEAAQAVQRSAFPSRYAERIGDMRAIWPKVQRAAGDNPVDLDGKPFATEGFGMEAKMFSEEGVVSLGSTGAAQATPLTPPPASAMVGAWGLDNRDTDLSMYDEDSMEGLLISPETNTIITQISQEVGGFGKGVDGWRQAVISAAKTALGTPYAWGGNSLQGGVDCSGLIQQAFAQAGINMPRVSYQQANSGQRVGLKALRPGDLVAWDNSSRNNGADHIALYLGNGQIIEAARPGTVVRIRSLGSNEGAFGVQINR